MKKLLWLALFLPTFALAGQHIQTGDNASLGAITAVSLTCSGSPCGTGSGGASTLAVSTGNASGYTGPATSSPTAIINFDSTTFNASLKGNSTAFVQLNSSSVTLQGQNVAPLSGSNNYIQNTNSLQTGATFYVSSGSISNLYIGNTTGITDGAVNLDKSATIIGSIGQTSSTPTFEQKFRWYTYPTTATVVGYNGIRPYGSGSRGNAFIWNDQNNTNIAEVDVSNRSVDILSTGTLKFFDFPNNHYIALRASATVAGNVLWTLPNADGTNGQSITTDGNGNLLFTTVTGGGGSSIAVTTGNAAGYSGVATSSPTTIVNFDSSTFNVSLKGGSTAFVQIGSLTSGNLPADVVYTDINQTITSSKTLSGQVNISSSVLLNGAAGTNGQVLTSGGPNTIPSWTTISGGGGGTSTLGVDYNGVSVTSPTAQINFVGPGVSVVANGSTSTVTISSWPAGTGGSGIVSAGTFTWVNNFGMTLSTVTVGNATSTTFGNNPYSIFNASGTSQAMQVNINGTPSGGSQNQIGGITINGPPNATDGNNSPALMVIADSTTNNTNGAGLLEIWENAPAHNSYLLWIHGSSNRNSDEPVRFDGPTFGIDEVNSSTDTSHGYGKWKVISEAYQGIDSQIASSRAYDNTTFENVLYVHPLDRTDIQPSGAWVQAQSLANDSGIITSSDTSVYGWQTQNNHQIALTCPLNPTASFTFALPSTPNNLGQVLYQSNNGRGNNNNARQWEFTSGGSTGQVLTYQSGSAPTWTTVSGGGGGSSSLGVFNGTVLISSPTSAIVFDSTTLSDVLQGASTSFVTLKGLTGDVTSVTGNLATTAAATQANIKTFTSSITVTGSGGLNINSGTPTIEIVNTSTDNAHGLGRFQAGAMASQGVDMQINSRSYDNSLYENLAYWHPLSEADGSGLYLKQQSVTNDGAVLTSSDTSVVSFWTQNSHTVGLTGPLNPTASWTFALPTTPNNLGQVMYQSSNGRGKNLNARQWDFTTGGSTGQVLTYQSGSAPTWTTVSSGGGSSSLAVTTGSVSGWTGAVTSSPTVVIEFDSATFKTSLQGSATAFVQLQTLPSALSALGNSWDGGGAALTTGTTYWVVSPASGTINKMMITATPSGSMKVNVSSSAVFGASTATSICASACPTLTSATSAQDSTLTGWTVAVAKDEILYFVVNSISSITQANLTLEYTKQ